MLIWFQAAWTSSKLIPINLKLIPNSGFQTMSTWFQAAWTSCKLISSNLKFVPSIDWISNSVKGFPSSLNKFQANFKQLEGNSKQWLPDNAISSSLRKSHLSSSILKLISSNDLSPNSVNTISSSLKKLQANFKQFEIDSKRRRSIIGNMISSSLNKFQANFKQFEIEFKRRLSVKRSQHDFNQLEQVPSSFQAIWNWLRATT